MPHSGASSARNPSRPRRSGSSLSDPTPGSRCRPLSGPNCVPRRTRRHTAPARLAVGQLDIDAGVVLGDTRHLTSAIDRHFQLADPAGQYALDVVLPQREPVRVPGGKVADVQTNLAEPRDLRHLPLRKEPVSDPTLIEDLDGARMQTARARANRVPGWRAARQWRRRLPPTPTRPPTSAPSGLLRQPPPHGRPSARPAHGPPPPTTTRSSRNPHSRSSGLGQRFCGMTRVLPQAPGCVIC